MKTDMKWNRFFKVCCLLLACSAMWVGCDRDYLWYDAGQKDGLRFLPARNDTTIVYTQALGGEWVTFQDIARVVGFTRDIDRHFKVEIVDALTTLPADRLSFRDTCYIPANETWGWLNFSYAYSEEDTLSLGLRIVENENFRPVMTTQICYILLPYKLSEPYWWSCDSYMFGQPWTPRLHELVMQFYHEVEQDNLYVWTTFFEPELGRNLEKAKNSGSKPHYSWGRWQAPYKELLRRFVARPLYDHLKAHPEDGDYNNMPDPYN